MALVVKAGKYITQ